MATPHKHHGKGNVHPQGPRGQRRSAQIKISATAHASPGRARSPQKRRSAARATAAPATPATIAAVPIVPATVAIPAAAPTTPATQVKKGPDLGSLLVTAALVLALLAAVIFVIPMFHKSGDKNKKSDAANIGAALTSPDSTNANLPPGIQVTISPTISPQINVNSERARKNTENDETNDRDRSRNWLTDAEFNSAQVQATVPSNESIAKLTSGRATTLESYTIPPHTIFNYPLTPGRQYVVVPWGNDEKSIRLFYNRIPVEEVPGQKDAEGIESYTFCNDTDFPRTVGFTTHLR